MRFYVLPHKANDGYLCTVYGHLLADKLLPSSYDAIKQRTSSNILGQIFTFSYDSYGKLRLYCVFCVCVCLYRTLCMPIFKVKPGRIRKLTHILFCNNSSPELKHSHIIPREKKNNARIHTHAVSSFIRINDCMHVTFGVLSKMLFYLFRCAPTKSSKSWHFVFYICVSILFRAIFFFLFCRSFFWWGGGFHCYIVLLGTLHTFSYELKCSRLRMRTAVTERYLPCYYVITCWNIKKRILFAMPSKQAMIPFFVVVCFVLGASLL